MNQPIRSLFAVLVLGACGLAACTPASMGLMTRALLASPSSDELGALDASCDCRPYPPPARLRIDVRDAAPARRHLERRRLELEDDPPARERPRRHPARRPPVFEDDGPARERTRRHVERRPPVLDDDDPPRRTSARRRREPATHRRRPSPTQERQRSAADPDDADDDR